jgi:MerR family transcriptional regulator, copper efflux regulator
MKSRSDEVRWSVGELAARFELDTHVLRYWEDMGLLSPERDAAGRRIYREDDAYRVAAILSNKLAGMSLEQIRGLVDASADGRRQMLRAHLDELDRRQAEIDRSRQMTEHALECRAHEIKTCPGFQAHVADIVDGTKVGLGFSGDHSSRHRQQPR